MKLVVVVESVLGPRYLLVDPEPWTTREMKNRLLDESIEGLLLQQADNGALTQVHKDGTVVPAGPEHPYLQNPNVRTFLGIATPETT